MNILVDEKVEHVRATGVSFVGQRLFISLSDGREMSLPIDQVTWLGWLAKATSEQRERWTIEPRGYAVYWEELDDGIEIDHLLSLKPIIDSATDTHLERQPVNDLIG